MSELIEKAATEELAAAAAAAEEAAAVEEAPAAAETVAEEAPAAPTESMADYKSELDSSMRTLKVGDIVDGTVAGISESDVTVDLGYYAEGVIRFADYSADPAFSVKESVKPGDAVKAVVLRMDDGHGNILLSRKNAMDALAWEKLKAMETEKTVTDVKISEAVKGGVVAYLDGVRAFIPASKLALEYVEDLTTFVGQTIPVRVIQAEREGKKLVLSSRDVLRERRKEDKARRVGSFSVGLVTEGTVDSLQDYGAFIKLGDGVDGLLHVSQISNKGRVRHPKDVLNVGDTVKVKIIANKDGKISLSMKALDESAPETRPEPEEKVVRPKVEKISTSLGSLLKNLKFD